MASRYNFVPGTYAGVYEDRGIKIGDLFSQDIYYRDATSAVINLSGYTGSMSIRDRADSDVDIITLTTENGRMTLTADLPVVSGDPNISLSIDASDTLALSAEAGDKFYDLQLIPANVEQAFTLIEGKFTIRF